MSTSRLMILRKKIDKLEHIGFDSTLCEFLVRECTKLKALADGKRVHLLLTKYGYDRDRFFGNILVHMYGNCGRVKEARRAFEIITRKNSYSWNMIIAAYTQNGNLLEAKELFDLMEEKDTVSWNTMITAYARCGNLQQAKYLFDEMLERNSMTWDVMLAGNGQCRHPQQVESTFNRMPQHDVISCNTMISSYSHSGNVGKAKKAFDEMPQLTVVTWNSLLVAYAQNGYLQEAQTVFEKVPERSIVAWTPMITVYAQHGKITRARSIFEEMPESDLVSWNAIIVAYCEHGDLQEARNLLNQMPEPDMVTETALLTAYVQAGDMQEARNMFDKMPKKDLVSWTLMIGAYAQQQQSCEAMELFLKMDMEGFRSDRVTFVSVLDACSLVKGKILHKDIVELGFDSDVTVGTAVFNMYARCGSLDIARKLFDQLPERDVISWSSMILAYAQNGHSIETMELFRAMAIQGVQPNEVTFLGILTGCSHAGWLSTGRDHFISIHMDYDMKLNSGHYLCMLDLLGRSGRLSDAEDLINNMPFFPSDIAWTILVGACKTHGDRERGSRLVENADGVELRTFLSNMFLLDNHAPVFYQLPKTRLPFGNS